MELLGNKILLENTKIDKEPDEGDDKTNWHSQREARRLYSQEQETGQRQEIKLETHKEHHF